MNTADLDQLTGSPRVARFFMGVTRPRTRRLGLDIAYTRYDFMREKGRFDRTLDIAAPSLPTVVP